MPRGAPLTVLDDRTALNGARIDVLARTSWIVRVARLVPPTGTTLTLEALAKRIGTNPARLHRLETGVLRDGALVDGYEQVLEAPTGSLRAPIDVTCRTFSYAPADRNGGTRLTTVPEVSRATERVACGEAIGGDWLAWARALSAPAAVGMPESLAAELIGRLVSELGRSVGPAYPSRYEALSLLRCSGYGHLVLAVAQQVVADQDVQVLNDLMSAVGEAVTPDAIDWCLALLDDPRDRLVIGGALALENMGEICGDPAFWGPLTEPLVERFDGAVEGSVREEWLSHLLRLVPSSAWSGTRSRPSRDLTPAAAIEDWTRSRLNDHWSTCEARAGRVTSWLGLPDQPMLARLLFDIAISPHESRAVTSYMLLGSHPRLASALGAELAELAESHPDPVIRSRVGRRLPGMLHDAFPHQAKRWLRGADRELRDRALLLAGNAGVPVEAEVLRTALGEEGASARAALYAAGMAAHPLLAEIASDGFGPCINGAAAWWLGQGSRVVA